MSAQPTLIERVTAQPTREQVVSDCVTLIDDEVRAKRGLGGVALRGAYATIKAIKRGFVVGVVDALLDDWVTQLEPYYTRWQSTSGTAFADYLTARSDDVANDLLKVTDARAETTKHTTARKAYVKMRGAAHKHVAAAVPKLGALLERRL